MPTHKFSDLVSEGYKRWYQFGLRSHRILYKRLRNKYRPIFRVRMVWQRATRGYSDEDCWSLDYHLARVTVAGVKKLRKWAHGYPSQLGYIEEWDAILAQIEEGFQTWLDCDGRFNPETDQEEKFKKGMAMYATWFGALWD